MHSTFLPISFSVDAIVFSTAHGSLDLNSRAFIFPCPFGFRLSTTPGPPLVSSLGFSTITCCPAYWRRISARRSNSAVLLLRIGPSINSSLPAIQPSFRKQLTASGFPSYRNQPGPLEQFRNFCGPKEDRAVRLFLEETT